MFEYRYRYHYRASFFRLSQARIHGSTFQGPCDQMRVILRSASPLATPVVGRKLEERPGGRLDTEEWV